MSVADMAQVGRVVDRELSMIVADLLAQRGIPRTLDQSRRMAEELHPQIVSFRRRMYRQAVVDMGKDMSALGLEVKPAPMDPYDVSATYSMINRAVGLGYEDMTVPVEILDDESKKMVTRRISPHELDDPTSGIVQVVAARVTASSSRHVRAAARTLMANTAEVGEVRDRRTRTRREPGYARVLTGKENCAFCAMLASRGGVYSSDTVTRRSDGRRYHDNCDCVARLVVRGYPWEGEEESIRLYGMWKEATRAEMKRRGINWVPSGAFFKAWKEEADTSRFTPLKD